MNNLVAQVIFEKENPSWPSNDGIYADFSKGKDQPEFYVKCPKCGMVSGNFKSFEAAAQDKICGACKFEAVEKHKSDLEKDGEPIKQKPGQKKKLPWPIQIESIVARLLEDDDDILDPGEYVHQTFDENWVESARMELAGEIGERVHLTDHGNEDYDSEYPNDIVTFRCKGDRTGEFFQVYRNESDLREKTENRLADEIMTEPEMFGRDFIQQFFDSDRLLRSLRMDNPEIEDPWQCLEELFGENEVIKEANQIAPITKERAAEAANLIVRIDGLGHHASVEDRIITLDGGACAVQIG